MRQSIELPAGGRATYLVTGSGAPLLWFEGGPGFPADLGLPDVELFADTFRAFLVDPPGVEGSIMPAGVEPDHLGHAYFYEQVRLGLGLPPVLAMGHSWGGLTALTYAATCPGSARGCVVINGFAGDPSVNADEAAEERRRGLEHRAAWPLLERALQLEQLGVDLDGSRHDDPDGVRWRLYFDDPANEAAIDHARRIKRAETRMSGEVIALWFPPGPYADVDIRPLLPAVRCPTLVAVGVHDILCGPAWARPILAGVRHADVVTFERSGHVPQYEQPDEFRAAVLAWYTDRVERPDTASS